MSAGPTEQQLRARLKDVFEERADPGPIGVRVEARWAGPRALEVAGREVRVIDCPSVLAFREALTAAEGKNGPPAVLLYAGAERELGADATVRLHRRRLLPLDRWAAVKALFGARRLDPRLAHLATVADALIEVAPAGGYAPVASGYLDLGTVHAALMRHLLGFSVEEPDLGDLLRWARERGGRAALTGAEPELRAVLEARIVASVGPGARVIVDLLAGDEQPDPLAIAVVARALFAQTADAEARRTQREAAIRLESKIGGSPLAPEEGAALGRSAWRVVRAELDRHGGETVVPILDSADRLLAELKGEGVAWLSDLSLRGADRRLDATAAALEAALDDERTVAPAERAVDALEASLTTWLQPERLESVEMGLRLVRWLHRSADEEPVASLSAAAAGYTGAGGWVDRARAAIWNAQETGVAEAALSRVDTAVAQRREAENERFGVLAAEWMATGSSAAAPVPVERVLEEVVVPLAAHAPVLVVVLDGMSQAVRCELAEDLTSEQWFEVVPEVAGGERLAGLATVPSVTSRSRASLLAGRLLGGTQQAEKAAFSEHPGLRSRTAAGPPPVLFHKAELLGAAGSTLATDVRARVADGATRVVGTVINAIDDHLARGDQTHVRWSLETIRPLRPLLAAAREGGRLVVLLSDHGHVVERGTEVVSSSGGAERWRPVGGELRTGELEVSGPRVLEGGGSVVVPWSERFRYVGRRGGYHGGLTPQEMVVPIMVLAPALSPEIPGWMDALPDTPEWWRSVTAPGPPVPAAPPPPPPPGQQIDLFPEGPASASGWIAALLGSQAFVSRVRAAGRGAPDLDRLQRLLELLEERGGVAERDLVAQRLRLSPLRVPGFLSAAQRVLNVDGYEVLAAGSDEARLDRRLLARQFELTEGDR